MANKRNLKKYMKTMAANLAGETLFILKISMKPKQMPLLIKSLHL